MQIIILSSIWVASLVVIIGILSYRSTHVHNENISSQSKRLEEEFVDIFFEMILKIEKGIGVYAGKIFASLGEHTRTLMREFLTERSPLRVLRERLAAFIRGNERYEKKGEASHFLRDISLHKENFRKNGDNYK